MPKYQLRGSREPPSSLQSWLRRGPPENCHEIEILSLRLELRNQVDINVSARILILVGVTSDRIDSRLCLYSSPTIRRQDGLQFLDKPYEATVGFFLVPSRRSIAGDIVSDAVNTAIHNRHRGIKEVFSLFSLDCWTTKAAQGLTACRNAQSQAAVAGCVLGSFRLMTKISFLSPQGKSLQMRKTFCQR